MRFRTKIIMIYAIFLFFASCFLGIFYYNINTNQIKENEYSTMRNTAKQFAQYFDETINSMEFVFSYILSDSNTVDALITLSSQENRDLGDVYFSDAGNLIRSKLTTDYIIKNFYRVIVFNDSDSIITGRYVNSDTMNYNTDISQIEWMERLEGSKGKPVLIGRHLDDWGTRGDTEVISLVKELQGMSMGYIEVQKRVTDLESIFLTPNENTEIIIVSDSQEIILSSREDIYNDVYIGYSTTLEQGEHEILNTVSGKKEIITRYQSTESRANIFVVQELDYITEKTVYILPVTVAITVCFFLLSVAFVIVVSTHLTKPLRKMGELMKTTEIDTLQNGIEMVSSKDDEIQRLNKSYQTMLKRLNRSITKEKRLSYLQLQAQFDLLQTQVNPHFLYNVLNVISNRGILNDDETICDICQSLADILRYATNTKERYAPIYAELEYLERYFYLLKSRYRHKLEYKMEVSPEIDKQIIPKIALQQIVENSIAHGYEKVSRIMVIEITGWQEDGRWYVKIKDNGQGFAEGKIDELMQKIDDVRKRLLDHSDAIEMEIGGMGIINTFARLLLIYGNELFFHIENDTEGAYIILGSKMEKISNANMESERKAGF